MNTYVTISHIYVIDLMFHSYEAEYSSICLFITFHLRNISANKLLNESLGPLIHGNLHRKLFALMLPPF